MCAKIAKTGLMVLLLSVLGFLAGAFLSMYGFIAIWWGFPGQWEPLKGLSAAPQEILAVKVPQDDFLLKTVDGKWFACQKSGDCIPSQASWGAEARPCGAGTRPGVASLFPILLSREVTSSLACEVAYTDTGHTIYVVNTANGAYFEVGLNLLPTDATILLIGVLFGLATALLVLLVAGIRAAILGIRRRRQATVPD